MKKEIDVDDLALQYLDGALTPEEREAVEQEIGTNTELADVVAFHRHMREDLALAKALTHLEEWHIAAKHEIDQPEAPITPIASRGGVRYMWGAAAAVALLLMATAWGVWQWQAQKRIGPTDILLALPERPFVEPARPSTGLGGESTALADRQKAVKAFNERRFEDASASFEAYLAQQPEDYLAQYYQALALLQLGKEAEAKVILEHLASKPLLSVRPDVLLRLAALYAMDERPADARQLLEEVAVDGDDGQKRQALALLDWLRQHPQ